MLKLILCLPHSHSLPSPLPLPLQDKIIENYEARDGNYAPRTVDLTYDAVRFYASNIILGLKHMHAREVIHRDMKPDNLLVDSKGYIQICDYGFSR